MIDTPRASTRLLQRSVPQLALAALPAVLAFWFGGYHVRHAGWAVLALCMAACVLAARGRLSTLRSPFGVAMVAMVALAAWTTASITWVDMSAHDAWVEAVRAAGYAAMFLLGGALLARARAYASYATAVGAAIALTALAGAARLATSDAPLRAFVAGRLDWPVGYAPGLAASCLIGMFLLLGASCQAQRHRAMLPSAITLGGAGACAAVAMLAQSRGTIPALAIGVIVSLVATPNRSAWLLRACAIVVVLVALAGPLGEPFQATFELRQAPFTEGTDEQALLDAAVAAAARAGMLVFAAVGVLAIAGAALVPAGEWVSGRVAVLEARSGTSITMPVVVLVVTIGGTLAFLGGGGSASAERGSWIGEQWRSCMDPPSEVSADPGSATSHFANVGTGRCDYYRVALASVRERPMLGLGAGNFRGEYVRERRTQEEPRAVHSLPLQLLAELGLLGAALGATVLACVLLAARRFVRSGVSRDATFAGAIGALGYWTAHASIDWLWQLPAVTLPMMALAGGLLACVSPAQGHVRRAVAAPIAGAAAVAAVALVLPVTMADARLRTSRDPDLRERDRAAAITAVQDAQRFDPRWAEPAITEAALRASAGQRREAADAARRAVLLEPRNWSVQLRASGLIGLDDTREGLSAFQRARELNPQLPAAPDQDEVDERATTSPDSLQSPDA